MTFRKRILSISPLAVGAAAALLLSCQLDEKPWDNPADPDGTNYHAPTLRLECDSVFVDSSVVSLRVAASSANSSIARVRWSVDGGDTSSTAAAMTDSVMELRLPGLPEGRHEVVLRVRDRTGLWSDPDTARFRVWNEPPEVSKVRDTICSVGRILSVRLSATDPDGEVGRYLLDTTGRGWDSTAMAPTLALSSSSERRRTVVWAARDDFGKTSSDTFVVVFTEKPVATPVPDTALSASRSLDIALDAYDVDPAGDVVKYLWSTSGNDWTDSSSDATIPLANAAGGTTTVRWVARNGRGRLSAEDTFRVAFVPEPEIGSVQADSFLAGWNGATGTVAFGWSGSVPGFPDEPVAWTLRLGTAGGEEPVYRGEGTSWSVAGIDSGRTYRYELVGTNRFGDSASATGSIRTSYPHPPETSFGIPWNRDVPYGYFIDTRDGQGYFTVKIGEQTWMAQNLNYRNTAGSSDTVGECYDGRVDSCAKYGRLYQVPQQISTIVPSGIQGVCPDGWHMPSDGEWAILVSHVDPSGATAGTRLKSAGGWDGSGNGTDVHGLRVLPSGNRLGDFYGSGSKAAFVTVSSDGDTRYRVSRWFESGAKDVGRSMGFRLGSPVRCVRD